MGLGEYRGAEVVQAVPVSSINGFVFGDSAAGTVICNNPSMALEQVCPIDGEVFVITDDECSLYRQLGIPLPRLSPDERTRRILARRNERVLYRRKCSATGIPIISIHNDKAPFPVFSQEYWWSDKWEQFAQGRDYDFSRGFFEQFAELYNLVPQIALNSPNAENSEWTNQSSDLKNCYMCICCGNSENCMYGMWNSHSQDCIDCGASFHCRWCYELFNCDNCFQCRYSDNLAQCSDCVCCRELIGCSNCIGCVGLEHKQYYYFNEPLSKERYLQLKQELGLEGRNGVAALQSRFSQFQREFPRRYQNGSRAEDSTGDYLLSTQNIVNGYNMRESRNTWNCRDGWNCHNSSSLVEVWTQDHCVEIEGSSGNTNCGFCNKLFESGNVWYSSHIYYSSDIFGCVSLKHAQYCILNKRYSKAEYEGLRARIIGQMRESGEFGENFPIAHSPFAYNLSMGQEYYPLTEEKARQLGYRWEARSPVTDQSAAWNVPDKIDDVREAEALSKTIHCVVSGRPFRIQKAEFEFYRNQGIPLPILHYDTRFYKRMGERRNPRRLYSGSCKICGSAFKTTYDPDSCYAVLCERCYPEYKDGRVSNGEFVLNP